MTNGKGSRPRPKGIDNTTWEKNWEKIFGKKKKNSSVGVDKPMKHDRMRESKRGNQSRD
jgi:hypothetical protein